MVFLENWYTPLLLAHLFVTFVLVGAMTHQLLVFPRYARGQFGKAKQEHRYLKVGFWSYVIVYVVGSIIYPAFRVHIRGALFDASLPWATGLFEVKEHWGAVGLAFFVVCMVLRKGFEPKEDSRPLYLYVPLMVLLNVIVWYKVVVGCYLSLLKGSFS